MRVLGREVILDDASIQIRTWARRLWNFPETADSLDSSFEVDVRSRPAAVPTESNEHSFWIESASGCCVNVVAQGDRAIVTAHGEPFDAWDQLFRAIAEALATSGLVLFHGGAIVRDDRAAVLLAPSGTGKSTTTMLAIKEGWRPIAEDLVWFDTGSGRIIGFDHKLGVRPGSVPILRTGFPHHELGPIINGKHHLAYEDIGGREWQATLTDVVTLRRSATEPSYWRRLSEAETAMTLLDSIGIANLALQRSKHAEIVGSLAIRLPGWLLHIGSTPVPLSSRRAFQPPEPASPNES